MRDADFIPAIVFGFLLGALVMLLLCHPQQLSINLLPSVVTGLITLVVGWWIHTAVRRRTEIERIPMDYMSDLNRRIRDLISACIGTSGNERLSNFRRLSIEVNELREFARGTRQSELKSLEKALGEHYIDFKIYLTDDDAVDKERASRVSSEIRKTALRLQWRICKQVLDGTTDATFFAAE